MSARRDVGVDRPLATRFDHVLRAGYLIFSAAVLIPLLLQAATAAWSPAWLTLVTLVVAGAVLTVLPAPALLPVATMVGGVVVAVVLAGRGLDTAPYLLLGLLNYVLVSRLTLRPAILAAVATATGYVLLSLALIDGVGARAVDDAVLGLSLCLAPIVFVHLLTRQLAEVDRLRHEQAEQRLAAGLAEAEQRVEQRSRGLLHDEVIGLLNMIADHTGGHDRLLRIESRRAADRLADGVRAEAESPGRTIGELVDRAAAQVLLTVDDRRADRSLAVRPEHASAVLRALGEALRNAQRHAGVDRAAVSARAEGDWLILEVSDEGSGIDTSRRGFGTEHSMVGALRELDGEVSLLRGPSGGTTVRLRWPHARRVAPAGPRPTRLATAHTDMARAMGDQGWLGYLIALPTLAGNLFVAARYLAGDPTWVAQAVLAVLVVVNTLITVRLVRRRALRWLELVAMAAWTAAAIAVGLALAELGALTDYDSWIIGLAAVPTLVLAFFLPWEGALLLLVPQLIVVGWTIDASGLTWWQAGGAVNAVVTPLIAGYVFGAYLRRARRTLDRTREAAHSEARLVHHRAVAAAQDVRQLHHARTVIGPWLRHLGEGGGGALASQETRAQARRLARQARDDLHAPGVLDDTLRRRIETARSQGTVVDLRPGLSADRAGPCVRILDRLLDAAGVDRVVLASSPETDRVEVVPRLPEDLLARVVRVVDGSEHEVRHDEFSTMIVLTRSPAAPGDHPMPAGADAC